MECLRAIDLCCGAGGWAEAARGLPIRVELAVDHWRDACMTYRLNHPSTTVVRADLTQDAFNWRRLAGRVDVVLGGIPCQWLSSYRRIAVRAGVTDEELEVNRRLLDAVLGIVKIIGPRWWCLEDVVQLRGELPILTPHQVLDARHWSPQRRKRLYVGTFPRPRPARDPRCLADCLRPGPYRVGPRLYGREARTHRSFQPDSCLAWIPDRKAPTVCGLSSRRDAEAGIVDDGLPGGLRQLEWQEAARLQGYPDEYLFHGAPTAACQMIANSVQIDMGRAILAAICRQAADEGRLNGVSGEPIAAVDEGTGDVIRGSEERGDGP